MDNNRIIAITGASKGVGRALAKRLAEPGNILVLGARRTNELETLAVELKSLGFGAAHTFYLDIANSNSVIEFFSQIKQKFGHIDILVNNAGIGLMEPIETLDLNRAQELININFFGPIRCCQHAIPLFRKECGKIINISSVTAFRGGPGTSIYAASKAALDRVSDSLRLELISKGIQTIQIHPGYIRETSFHDQYPKSFKTRTEENSLKAVIAVIYKAIEKKNPRPRYFANFRGFLFAFAAFFFPALFDRLQLRISRKSKS